MDEFNSDKTHISQSINTIIYNLNTYISTLEDEITTIGYNPFKRLGSNAKKRIVQAKAFKQELQWIHGQAFNRISELANATRSFIKSAGRSTEQFSYEYNPISHEDQYQKVQGLYLDFIELLNHSLNHAPSSFYSKTPFRKVSPRIQCSIIDEHAYAFYCMHFPSFKRHFKTMSLYYEASASARIKIVSACSSNKGWVKTQLQQLLHYEKVRIEYLKLNQIKSTYYSLFSYTVKQYYQAPTGYFSHRYNDLLKNALVDLVDYLGPNDIANGLDLIFKHSHSTYMQKFIKSSDYARPANYNDCFKIPSARVIENARHFHQSIGHGYNTQGEDILIAILERAETLIKYIPPKQLQVPDYFKRQHSAFGNFCRQKLQKAGRFSMALSSALLFTASPADAATEILESKSEESVAIERIYKHDLIYNIQDKRSALALKKKP